MKIQPRGKYRIKGQSPYFLRKYGTSNPVIIIKDKSTNIWPNGDWFGQKGNIGCELYRERAADENLPETDVWYGKIDSMGELVHESELEEVLYN